MLNWLHNHGSQRRSLKVSRSVIIVYYIYQIQILFDGMRVKMR